MGTLRTAAWNDEEGRLRAPWRLLVATIVLALGTVAALVAVGFLVTLAGAGELFFEGVSGIVVSGGVSLVAVTVLLWAVARYVDRRRFEDYGLRIDDRWWADLAFGLALGAALQALVFLAGWAAGWFRVTGLFVAEGSFPLLLAGTLGLFLAVGIYEELLTRGWLLTNLAEGFRFAGQRVAVAAAVLLSSGVFGVLHLGNPGSSLLSATTIALAGVFLAAGYLLTGELGIPIGIHITWNFFQGPVFGFAVSGLSMPVSVVAVEPVGPEALTGGEFGPEAGLLGVAAMALGTAAIAWWGARREGRLAVHERVTVPELLERKET